MVLTRLAGVQDKTQTVFAPVFSNREPGCTSAPVATPGVRASFFSHTHARARTRSLYAYVLPPCRDGALDTCCKREIRRTRPLTQTSARPSQRLTATPHAAQEDKRRPGYNNCNEQRAPGMFDV